MLLLGAGGKGVAVVAGPPVVTLHGAMDNTTGTDANVTTDNGAIAAGEMVVYMGATLLNRSLSTITDPSGDTWTKAAAYAPNSSQQIICAWKIASAAMPAGTVITATISGSGTKQAFVKSITNMDVAQSVVQGTGAFGTSTAPAASITPANASDVVLSIVGVDTGAADTFTHDAAFSNPQNRLGAVSAAYSAQKLPGSTSLLTKTDTNSASRAWIARLFAFKAA